MRGTTAVAFELERLRLRPLVQQAFEDFGVPGGVVVVVQGERELVIRHGMASLAENSPVTRNTLFSVGSVTKTFVATALAALVGEGLLRWDDRVVQHVPEFALADPVWRRQATLRDCVANRLGLSRQGFCEWGASDRVSIGERLHRLRHTPSIAPPGDRFSYVNPGHSAVALAVARAAGERFTHYLRRLLGRARTGGLAAGQEVAMLPRSDCHVRRWSSAIRSGASSRQRWPEVVRVDPMLYDNAIGGTGLWMSGDAMVDWLRMHLGQGSLNGKTLMPAACYEQICIPQVHVPEMDRPFGIGAGQCSSVDYGLGWFCTRYRGVRVLRHSGAEVGANAHLAVAPEAGFGVGVMANVASPAADAIGLQVVDACLGMPGASRARCAPGHWLEVPSARGRIDLRAALADKAALQPCIGSYAHPGNGAAEVSIRGDGLAIRFVDAPRFDGWLRPRGGMRFCLNPWDAGLREAVAGTGEFVVSKGRAVSFEIPGLGTWRRG